MTAKRAAGSVVRVAWLLVVGVAGCNAILDNKPAELRSSTHGQSPSACSETQRLCHGTCVDREDPNYGCGAPSCEPCSSGHGTATCHDGVCAVGACDPGYACAKGACVLTCAAGLTACQPEAVCTNLQTDPNHCGSCDVVCGEQIPGAIVELAATAGAQRAVEDLRTCLQRRGAKVQVISE